MTSKLSKNQKRRQQLQFKQPNNQDDDLFMDKLIEQNSIIPMQTSAFFIIAIYAKFMITLAKTKEHGQQEGC